MFRNSTDMTGIKTNQGEYDVQNLAKRTFSVVTLYAIKDDLGRFILTDKGKYAHRTTTEANDTLGRILEVQGNCLDIISGDEANERQDRIDTFKSGLLESLDDPGENDANSG